jgi:tetratricopeptide (TPR) repeat protein
LNGWGYGGYGYGGGYPYYNNYYYYGYPYDYNNGSSSYDYSQPMYNSGYLQPAYNNSMPPGPPDSLSQAISVFQSGNFQEAERLAHHVVIDEPNNARAHLVLSLTAFANADFRTAANEARNAINLGETPNWSQVYAIYGNLDRYTSNLRALENAVKQNPRDPDAQFLLGFMYLANGYRSDAQEHLAMAHEAMPEDRIVGNLLSQAGGQVMSTAARPNAPRGAEGTHNAPINVQPGNAPANIGPSNNAPMNVQPGNTGTSTGPTNGQKFNQPPAPPTDNRSSRPGNSSVLPSAPRMPPTGNRSY